MRSPGPNAAPSCEPCARSRPAVRPGASCDGAELVDPVVADHGGAGLDLADPSELPAAGLDQLNRSDVVVVAVEQHLGNADRSRHDQSLTQDLGSAAASPVTPQHAVADVPGV